MPTTLNQHLKAINPGKLLAPLLQDYIAGVNRDTRDGTVSHKAAVVADAKLTIAAMKLRIKEFNHGEPPTKKVMIHPSSIGGCMRAIWYSHFDAPRDIRSKADELKSYLIFEVGTYFHVLFQNLLEQAGILVRREITIVDMENRILGHCDAVVKIGGLTYAVEIKTINSRQFTMLNQPKHAHLQQAHCYMKSLGLTRCIFLYYDKDRSMLKEFIVQFDPVFYKQHVSSRIKKVIESVETRKQPERETEGANQPPCIFCDFASLCYSEEANRKFAKKVAAGKRQLRFLK